jgi:hypothetical protein
MSGFPHSRPDDGASMPASAKVQFFAWSTALVGSAIWVSAIVWWLA